MKTSLEKTKYLLKTWLWILSGYGVKPVSLGSPQKLTVLITYYNPVRMQNINHQIRNVLRCNFVEKLIISNHNPEIQIQNRIKSHDSRLVVLNQPVRRGCGFRWQVAHEFDPEYLIVIDDDFLVTPTQLTNLFQCLLAEPGIPHGLSGMCYLGNGGFEFRDRDTAPIDFLCEIYAVTREQLRRYIELYSAISSEDQIAKMVDATADFMVISRTGVSQPKIHDLGRIFRDETFKKEGVAVHKDQTFDQHVEHVLHALENVVSVERG